MGNYNRLLPGGDLVDVTRQLQALSNGLVSAPAEVAAISSEEDLGLYHNLGAEILRQATDQTED